MPRRTLGLEQIQVRPGRNRKKRLHPDLADLEGLDLLELFYGFFARLPPAYLTDERKGHYIRIDEVIPLGRSVTVVAESGHYGNPGQTIDVETHETSHHRTEIESATDRTRLTFFLPKGIETGLFLVERQGFAGAGHELIDAFRRALVSRWAEHSFDTANVLYPDAWAKGADLLEVEAVAYSYRPDIADGLTPQGSPLGNVKYSIVPTKGMGGVLPAKLYAKLRAREVTAAQILALKNEAVDETFVTVRKDGRKKTFALEKDRSPSVRIELTAPGEPMLTDTPFIRRCQDEAREFYEQIGLVWQDQWRDGQWTDEQKSRRLEPHHPSPNDGA